jgi:hypothetical protein
MIRNKAKIAKYISAYFCLFFLFPTFGALSQDFTLISAPPIFNNLKNKNVGYINFVPLSPNYPFGYLPKERVFTGEIFSSDSKSEISSAEDIFVPEDFLNILEATFENTLRYGQLHPKKYASIKEAGKENVPFVIQGILMDFQVKKEKVAIVRILYRIYDGFSGKAVWEGEIKNSFVHEKLPSSLQNIDVFLIERHLFNFQPQRTLLAFAVYNNTIDLMNQLKSIVDRRNK